MNRTTLRGLIVGLVFFIPMILSFPSLAAKQSWTAWVVDLRQEAVDQGIRPEVFDDAFRNIRPNKRVMHFDRTQPERRMTFLKYRNTRADNFRIKMGRRKYKKYREILEKVGRGYGVSPCFIASLWGMETSYGHFMGSFPVIRSLATLSYDGRRTKFFRKELLLALRILNEGHVDKADFKGEWAGASGHPQFLPSSWFRFAVDYNGDGRKDIWSTHSDVFASIANYLAGNGWKVGQPWGVEVSAPRNIDKEHIGYKYKQTVEEWLKQGVRIKEGWSLPERNYDLQASLIEPYGGPDYLVFKNFKVLLRYNNSTFYAGTVAYLADNICRGMQS